MRYAHSILIVLGSIDSLTGLLNPTMTKVFIQVFWKIDIPVSRTPDKDNYNAK